jgi:23S rRNA (adenine2503-C2)-methyltransferase
MAGNDLKDVTALNAAERAAFVDAAGEPPYRAGQLEKWLFARAAAAFDEMTDLPAAFRDTLARTFYIPRPAVLDEATDDDGTVKYLLELRDGALVEAVYMPGGGHDAACLSCQAGCRFDCRICATGTLPFRRNLTAYEIFAQFALIQGRHPESRIRNAVLMGQGEPLGNFRNVTGGLSLLREHFDVGSRRITASTVGIPEGIVKWADEGPAVKLAVSLNSAIQKTRDLLMPAAARYRLDDLAGACEYYTRRTRRRLTFEYVLCDGVNDDRRHARALVAFTRHVPCKINVIPFNEWPGAPHKTPSEEKLAAFLGEVARGPMALTVRQPRGAAVHAACGTLANRTPAAIEG